MIDDPVFWLCAVFAVLITGVSKGGMGGMAVFAVPLMALTISPVQAAGIMLPILVVMDGFTVTAYRKHWDKKLVFFMLPFAVAGIALGGLLAQCVSEDFVRICIGIIALSFVAFSVIKPAADGGFIRGNTYMAALCGALSGFTSFLAHAGGPPFKIYALPQGLPPRIFAGSAAIFFAVVNMTKLLPYALLGQLSGANLKTSLVLIPLAPIGVWTGVWLVKKIDPVVFYRIMYSLLTVVGLKLLWDGLV